MPGTRKAAAAKRDAITLTDAAALKFEITILSSIKQRAADGQSIKQRAADGQRRSKELEELAQVKVVAKL